MYGRSVEIGEGMNRKHLLAAAVLLCGTGLVTACNGQTAVDGNSEVISSVDVSQEEAQDVSHAVSQEVSQADSESGAVNTDSDVKDGKDDDKQQEGKVNYSLLFNEIKRTEAYKGMKYANPLITQEFGADPYAMVYDDTVYIYMTQDVFEKSSDGTIKDNSYSKIKSIRVISSKDMVNWTDHGEIHVADGIVGAKWAKNSWAPAVAWKNIDGQDKFFLYFADGGGGIGVLEADSPTGPFKDPLGHGLITRNTPNCADVLWLFDPAVLVDDDGKAYIYFGGGVPSDKISHPMTARCVELGDDMISIKGEPVTIDAPYLFEDSGIHKYNDKYYYTYCSNWQVDEAGTAEYGFHNAEIVSMESDSPLGPFTFKEVILENPGKLVGLYGNNHHCVFSFKNDWYITYHTRELEKQMGVEKGYRCTFIDKFDMGEDGTIGRIKQTYNGCGQVGTLNPYETVAACTFSHEAGIEVVPADRLSKTYGSGKMALGGIDSGDYIKLTGVDFSHKEPESFVFSAKKTAELDENCVIELRLDSTKGDVLGYIPVGQLLNDAASLDDEFVELTAPIDKKVSGVHNLYMTFSGSGYELLEWRFEGVENNWYDKLCENALISTGNNGRLERALAKLEAGENVNIAFLGGSITEGASASKQSECYVEQTVSNLKAMYPDADINYVNAGVSGTPSALGIMRYQRDIVGTFDDTPDILFIEFAVNDYQECTDGRAMESLIRQALEADEKTAVCLLYSVSKSKWNVQDVSVPMGELYGLPMVSLKDGTKEAFESGALTDEEYFTDDYHPTTYGHTIMADCIKYMFTEAAKKEVPAEASSIPDKMVKGADFDGNRLVTSKDSADAKIVCGGFDGKDSEVHGAKFIGGAVFPDNWMHTAQSGDAPFVMTVDCRNLLINYKQSKSKNAGTVVINVDGEDVMEIDCYKDGAWNQSIVELVIDEKDSSTHTVSIRMKDGDEDKEFTILALSYTK